MGNEEEKEEIQAAIEALHLGERLTALPEGEAESLYARIAVIHSTRPRARWIWEHLREPTSARRFMDGRAYTHLAAAVPDVKAPLLFFPGSDEDVTSAFRGDIEAISSVLGGSFAVEYVIAPVDLAWIIGENHHDVLFGRGAPAARLVAEMTVGELL